MPRSSDWPVVALALLCLLVAIVCLIGVILLNWRPRTRDRRGFQVVRPANITDARDPSTARSPAAR